MEVKGTIAEFIARSLSHDKLNLFSMKVGVNPDMLPRGYTKPQKAVYILNNMSDAHTEIALRAVIESAKKATWDEDLSHGVIGEINFVLERTMNCRMNDKGELIPIFDTVLGISNKQSYLEKKLNEMGFSKSLSHYQGAIKSYRSSPKGAISLLRASYESVVEEILTKEMIAFTSNFKNSLKELVGIGLLKELDRTECPHCHYRKRDNEYNFAYDFYSLLSHYGSHTELVTEHVANWLYTSTSSFIWFLINRYETTIVTK